MTGLTQPTEGMYICPGETHPISRSVHLSRLASFFPTCRDCPLRTDTGHLPRQTIERLQGAERRVERTSFFCTEGVRGAYINEINRRKAGEVAAALAALLWDESPLIGRTDAQSRAQRRNRPAVIVGHDERSSSPDIVKGVAASLRRMGCHVIDISLTTKPCFWFAVNHLEAAAGMFVTGAGSPPSWTGLDFAGRGGLPLSQVGSHFLTNESGSAFDLTQLEERLRRPFSRATRHAGSHSTFQAQAPYEAGLWKHFHALRPLTVVCGVANRLVERTLVRIFDQLPGRLIGVDLPIRVRDLKQADDPDVSRVRARVIEHDAHFGCLIDEDGQSCALLDESGALIPPERTAALLADDLLLEQPDALCVIAGSRDGSLTEELKSLDAKVAYCGPTMMDIASAMNRHHALFAGGDEPRYWFREAFPACDAILTLAHVMALLSRSDATFSQVATITQ